MTGLSRGFARARGGAGAEVRWSDRSTHDRAENALTLADELVTSLMQARGYPVWGYEEIAEDVSVAYPRMIGSYRTAHGVATRALRGEASIEELRMAMIHYRGLFLELAQPETPVFLRSVA